MTIGFVDIVLILACATTWLLAGVFLAFSDFVMKSLAALSPQNGIRAMQVINEKVLRSFFVTGLIVIAVLSLVYAGSYLFTGEVAGNVWVLTGALVYLVTVLVGSLAGNIPMNNKLATFEATTKEAADYWMIYVVRWTKFNHLRTVGCASAAVCFSYDIITRL